MRYVGVDLHKQNFVVCFLDDGDTTKLRIYTLSAAGLEAFCRDLHPDDHMAVETAQNAYYFYDRVRSAVSHIVLVVVQHPEVHVLVGEIVQRIKVGLHPVLV